MALQWWLNQLESHQRIIIYEADAEPTEGTERCLRQADHVVLVADASEDPSPAPIERLLTFDAIGPRRSLVLLHPNGDCMPAGTKRWLEMAGCGMVDPAVFECVSSKRGDDAYHPEHVTGFAFGFGLDRLAMNMAGVPDIRSFIESDQRFLSQFR